MADKLSIYKNVNPEVKSWWATERTIGTCIGK